MLFLAIGCGQPLSNTVQLQCEVETAPEPWDDTLRTLLEQPLAGHLAWLEHAPPAGSLETFELTWTPQLEQAPTAWTVTSGDCDSGVSLPVDYTWTSGQGELMFAGSWTDATGPTVFVTEEGVLRFGLGAEGGEIWVFDPVHALAPDAYEFQVSFDGNTQDGGSIGLSTLREDSETGVQHNEPVLSGVWGAGL